ncbi:MAG: hypothetical protein ACRDK7_08005, partial [Solirubrobacteraceae bacterium]
MSRGEHERLRDIAKASAVIKAHVERELCRRRLRIYETPIAYYGRTYEEGKNITWRDGFRAVFVLLRT